MQQMQSIFNLRMEPIATHEAYPKYARSETKPVGRARQIVDHGIISDHPCSSCVELKQDCYRWEGTFSRCAWCTSKDKKKELCHLPGREASPAPERRKRRKITHNIYAPSGYAASTADTMTGTLVSGTLASGPTPFSGIPLRPIPEPAVSTTSTIHTQVAPPAVSEYASQATLERVTALESQVSGLEAKVMEMLVKLDEVSSCVSSSSTSQRQAAAGASPTTNDITFGDLQARHLSNAARRATEAWVEGPKTSELLGASSPVENVAVEKSIMSEHTVEHADGYRPVNCGCTGP